MENESTKRKETHEDPEGTTPSQAVSAEQGIDSSSLLDFSTGAVKEI
jgi:hypothetical protein